MRLAYLFLLLSIFSADAVDFRADAVDFRARLDNFRSDFRARGDWEMATGKSINSNPLNVPMPKTEDTVQSASNKITADAVIIGFALLTGGLLMH